MKVEHKESGEGIAILEVTGHNAMPLHLRYADSQQWVTVSHQVRIDRPGVAFRILAGRPIEDSPSAPDFKGIMDAATGHIHPLTTTRLAPPSKEESEASS